MWLYHYAISGLGHPSKQRVLPKLFLRLLSSNLKQASVSISNLRIKHTQRPSALGKKVIQSNPDYPNCLGDMQIVRIIECSDKLIYRYLAPYQCSKRCTSDSPGCVLYLVAV